MKNQTELNREYWTRIYDMCEGNELKMLECVRIKDNDYKFTTYHPTFTDPITEYELAITILDDEPLFAGDIIYCKDDDDNQEYKLVALSDNGSGVLLSKVGSNAIENFVSHTNLESCFTSKKSNKNSAIRTFYDLNNQDCSIQKSSLNNRDAIFVRLSREDINDAKKRLNKDQIKILLEILQKFVYTDEI